MSTVTDKEWMYFEEEDKLSMKYIKALEAKNLVVSTDHGRFILLRPRGIYESHKGTYIVCQHYDEHFEDITHEI